MWTSGALIVPVALQLAFTVTSAECKKVITVETVYMSYPSAAVRTQFLNQLQTMWMNELDQFQLVGVPRVEFISEEKDIGTMPGTLGGTPANKVTYRLTGTTALPFDLGISRQNFQDETMAGHMGPISFSLGEEHRGFDDSATTIARPRKPFSYDATVYVQYDRDSEKDRNLMALTGIWKFSLAHVQGQMTPPYSPDLTITVLRNQPTDQANFHKITYQVTGTANYTTIRRFDNVLGMVNDFIRTGQRPGLFADLPGTLAVAPSMVSMAGKSTVKPFTFHGVVYLEFEDVSGFSDLDKLPLLQQVAAIWKSVLVDRGTPSADLSITVAANEPTVQKNIHKITYKVSGTAAYDTPDYFDAVFVIVSEEIESRHLRHIFAILPETSEHGPSARPIFISTAMTTAKPFSYDALIYLKFSQEWETGKLLSHILAAWKSVLTDLGNPYSALTATIVDNQPTIVDDVHKIFYRVTGTAVYDGIPYFDKVREMVKQYLNKHPFPGVHSDAQHVPNNTNSKFDMNTDTSTNGQQAGKVDWTAQGKSDVGTNNVVLRTSILLPYSNKVQLDAAIQYIRQLYAFILGVKLGEISIGINSDQVFDEAYQPPTKIHNVTYSVVVTSSAALNLTANDVAGKFDQLLGSTVESFRSTVNPQTVRLLDPSRGQRVANKWGGGRFDDSRLKTFMVYGSIDSTYRTKKERRDIMNQLRDVWENAVGRKGSIVDLSVHQDIRRQDGYRRIYYVVTILSEENRWNMRHLNRKYLAALMKSNIPLVRIPPASNTDPDINPPSNYGGRAYSLYDNIVVTYKNDRGYDNFLEALRRAWEKVLGNNAEDVQIIVNSKEVNRKGGYLVSYIVTFSSSDDHLDVDSLSQDFVSSVGNIKGRGFTSYRTSDRIVIDAPIPAPVAQSQPAWKPQQRPASVTKPKDQPAWKQQPQPAWKRQPAIWKPVAAQATTSYPVTMEPVTDEPQTQPAWKPQPQSSWVQPQQPNVSAQIGTNGMDNRIILDEALDPTYQVAPTNIYLISDQFRLTANSDAERASYMDQLDNAWQTAIGNTTEFVQLVLYRDDALPGQNANTHDLGYVVIIVSSNTNLDLNPFKATFDRIKPHPPVGLVSFAADLVPSPHAFLVLRDTIPRAYSSNADRDAFLAKLQKLYINALGNDALTVSLAVYDDDLLDRMLDAASGSQIKDLHQLSYFVLLVSNRILDQDDVQNRFQQYLISQAVSCVA